MATLEKHIQKKKKKKQHQRERNDETSSSMLSLDFNLTTTRCDKILSHECFVSPEFKQQPDKECNVSSEVEISDNISQGPTPENDNRTEVSKADIDTDKANNDKEVQAIQIEPSAPDFEVSAPPLEQPVSSVVRYPDLNELSITESVSVPYAPMTYRSTKMKAYTQAQLREIYTCADIETAKQFELEFLANSLQDNYSMDPLYNLLIQYFNARSKLRVNIADISKMQESIPAMQEKIWDFLWETVEFSGVCGDNLKVQDTDKMQIAKLNEGELKTFCLHLAQLHEIVCVSYTTNMINAERFKFEIDQIIREILSYPVFGKICSNDPVILNYQPDSGAINCIQHLKRAISILFCFTRKHSPDKVIMEEVQQWLTSLISLYLRVATKQDHWFLLFHILRCPGGVSSWATPFFQIPKPTNMHHADVFNSPEINHCIVSLYILLFPIKKRNEFLTKFHQLGKDISDPVKEDLWILIDSDGEDDSIANGDCAGLKESDLVNFLNQIPFETLFKSILNIDMIGDNYNIQPDLISGDHLIKLIAFNSILIELLGGGLVTYNTERYKQFAKRLGRLVRHCVQYISDFYELYLQNNMSKNANFCDRISTEFNMYVLKACGYIYKVPSLGTWQYFSSLPFGILDSETSWQLLYYLNVGFPQEFPPPQEDFQHLCESPEFYDKFNITISDISSEDLYYLLQSFFEMAVERQKDRDWNLIKFICAHVFHIGFVNEATRDLCYKISRDMLASLTVIHSDLISVLLAQLRDNFENAENSVYLFKALCLKSWRPTIESFEIISRWLLNNNYEKKENLMSRIILTRLNWGTVCDKLFLPRDIHIRTAFVISESLTKHAPEFVGLSGISESVRQVSNLMESQTSKEQFQTWCWNMISTFKIHLMDQSSSEIRKTLQYPAEQLKRIPDLEDLDIVFQGVTENRPLAMYLAMLVSQWGHSIPLICQKGFPLLKSLLTDCRHSVVLRCLQLIVPQFLECPESLIKCESFQEIMKMLLNSDKTYIKMAKDLMSSNLTGPVIELMENMVQSMTIYYTDYGFHSPNSLIMLWIQVLTNIQNWQKMDAVYIVDAILKVAYVHPEAWRSCKEYFRNFFNNTDDWKAQKSTLKMLLGASVYRSLPAISPDYAWLNLLLLEIEHELQEKENNLWFEFLRQISLTTDKVNLDNALKKAANLIGCTPFPASSLVLYKYANFIPLLDEKHPLFPIYTQNFFRLYLARIPFDEDVDRYQYTYGVADKFYEYNISLMKKVKTHLKRAEDHYAGEANKNAQDDVLGYFYTNCSKIMKTYRLWLEETSLNTMSKEQNINLPPQFNIPKLKEIFYGNDEHWTEFLHLPTIRKEQKEAAYKWLRTYSRGSFGNIESNAPLLKSKTSPLDRIKVHLKSYDNEVRPPDFTRKAVILIPILPGDINESTLNMLTSWMNKIEEQCIDLNLLSKNVSFLNAKYKELIQTLYKNVFYYKTKHIRCSSLFSKSPLRCIQPATIEVKMQKPLEVIQVRTDIEINRSKHDNVVEKLMSQETDVLVLSMQKIAHCVRYLTVFRGDPNDGNVLSIQVSNVAIKFFYQVISSMNENLTSIPATKELCFNLLSELGVFIRDNNEQEGIKILSTALKRPELIKSLSELLVPSSTKPECFLRMYKYLVECHMRRCDKSIMFVLLSKFDLQNWLTNIRPKLSEINALLKLVITGLETWAQPDTTLLQDIFRRHLIHIFEHEFPEHYGEVLQMVLTGCSEQKLMPEILSDLLNSMLLRSGCESLPASANQAKISEEISKFCTQQKLFNFKELTETIMMFARHFQKERLQHGLHGLYPKHKNYCRILCAWFECLSHAVIVSAIYTYPGVLADQICDWIFPSITEMYSPWLVSYTGQNVQQSTANWIRQLIANGKVLFPWSELYTESAQFMLLSYVKSLNFILDSLPVASSILGHAFGWYVYHFANQDIGPHIKSPVHSALVFLPWEKFSPAPMHIEMMQRVLNEFLPESHSFLGHIILRTQWAFWIKGIFSTWNSSVQSNVLSLLLTIFIQISFEPDVHDDKTMGALLKDILQFQWHLIEFEGLESILNWCTASMDPAIVLAIPTERNDVDRGVLELLKIASCMVSSNKGGNSSTVARSKRILYTRTFVRLLRICAGKHQKLLETKQGLQCFKDAIFGLIETIEKTSLSSNVRREDCEVEAQNMIFEVINILPSQSEQLSRIFVEAIISWQTECIVGSLVLNQTLNAIGLCKTFSFCMYSLLETTIFNYFRWTDETKHLHYPAWNAVLNKLAGTQENIQIKTILQGPYLLILHCHILFKIRNMSDNGAKIMFLQDISQLLENIKTNEISESKMAIIWGAIISCGCGILESSDNAKKPLLMLARYLQVISTQAESWGEGLLGVIGLKRDAVSNRRKVLTRCLSCIIFSLFPDRSSDELKPNQEFFLCLEDLKNVANNKKYSDVKVLVSKAVDIIEENRFPQTEQVVNKICSITQLLYDDCFLTNLSEVWIFDKCS